MAHCRQIRCGWLCEPDGRLQKQVLRPEEGTKYERFAEVEHRPYLSKASADLKAAETACYEKGGVYTRVEDLRAFINQATSDSGTSKEANEYIEY